MLVTLQTDKSVMRALRIVRHKGRIAVLSCPCQRKGKVSCHMVDEWPQCLPVVMMSLMPRWQRMEWGSLHLEEERMWEKREGSHLVKVHSLFR